MQSEALIELLIQGILPDEGGAAFDRIMDSGAALR